MRRDLDLALATHAGRRRPGNEDDVLAFEPADPVGFARLGRLFAVADGIGGARGGAEASRLAVRAFLASWLEEEAPEAEESMRRAFQAACRRVYEASLEHPHLAGMGTTLTAVRLREGTAEVGHVGDSRCLLVREGRVVRLTEDHSAVQGGSELTRCIGGGRDEETMDYRRADVRPGDCLVLCTDGLWSVVDEEEIAAAVRDLPAAGAAARLVARANAAGGPDNVTVLVARLLATPAEGGGRTRAAAVLDGTDSVGRTSPQPPRTAWRRWRVVLALLAILAATAAAALLAGLDPARLVGY